MMNTIPDPRVLSARNLSKHFGDVRALDQVSIDIPPGQSVSVMGPSGSGKSTLLHCLAGILRPDDGDVSLGDEPVSLSSDAARSRLRLERMGFVFQDGQLLPELPALENVALPLLLLGRPKAEAFGRAAEWLSRLGLSGLEKRRPGQLSGGQAHRVAIARALVGSPAVVLADEPTGALDQATGAEVMRVLTAAAKGAGASLVVVTHDPNVAAWCERHVEIVDGRVLSDVRTGMAA
jgi:putative ABC transport system ATP-binding protein